MSKLFEEDNSDSDGELKINDGYANNYNNWRQKEELNKLKTKYGEHIKNLESSNEESESSSEDDEGGNDFTEEFEKDFYKTLACLKKKDPSIYDENTKFFTTTSKTPETSNKKSEKKEKSLSLRDYERRIILEKDGKLSDSEDEDDFRKKTNTTNTLTYVEEQRQIKKSIAEALNDDEEGDLLQPKQKSESEKQKEEESFKEWLKGQSETIDASAEVTLKPLRDFWTDPNLDENEKFLRDYILNKKFLERDSGDHERLHDSDDNLDEDEKNIEKQEEFEHKYNFRFEEPDQEFIKQYPRTMENSLRKKDTRRAEKRAEVKKRKEDDKLKKQEELKQLKALKRKEIADKIAQLKEITGNDDMKFDAINLDGDFDPAEHDKKMQELFDEEYYAEGDEAVKPEFPEIDEELGIEDTWDNYDPNSEEIQGNDQGGETHCEDPEFNMDADYDPSKSLQEEMVDASKKKKRRRRSKFAEMIAKDKPKFNPSVHASYKDYIDQYYALDYEDMIGDLPCRFRYRNVVPNDYGLSVEEILMADDKELNKWCSLKKALEHKPEHAEMREVKMFQQKGSNEGYKRKILQSLYKSAEEEVNPAPIANGVSENDSTSKKKRRRNKKKSNDASTSVTVDDKKENANDKKENLGNVEREQKSDKKKRKTDKAENVAEEPENKKMKKNLSDETINDEINNKTEGESIGKARKNNNKTISKEMKDNTSEKVNDNDIENIKNMNSNNTDEITTNDKIDENNKKTSENKNKQKKKKKQVATGAHEKSVKPENSQKNSENGKSKQQLRKEQFKKLQKNKMLKGSKDPVVSMSDERLKAYGINPKTFKNKLKYGKSSK